MAKFIWLKPVSKKSRITQAQADKAVREYVRSKHGIACRLESKANAKAST